jgi:hypothetical protein
MARQLKSRSADLAAIERTGAQARVAAADTLATVAGLRDLGAIGRVRLTAMKDARSAMALVKEAGARVGEAHKRTEAIRTVNQEVVQLRHARHDVTRENEASQFQTWKRINQPPR